MIFNNTFINIIKILTNKVGLAVDATLADQNSIVNYVVDSQIDILELISNLCEYTNHIFEIRENTLFLIDKKIAFNSDLKASLTLDNFVKEVAISITDNDIIKSYKAEWTLKSIAENGIKEEKQNIQIEVLGAGEEKDIKVYDFVKENIEYELNKKLWLYNLQNIQFSIFINSEFINLKIGDKVSFDDGIKHGELLITKLNIKPLKGHLDIGGVGNVDYRR